MMRTDVLVVIVSWNTRQLLVECLASVIREVATLSPIRFEICVVDNASSDGSAEAVEAGFASVELVRNQRNVGFAAANNQALRTHDAEAFLLLNSDAAVCPGAFGPLVRFLEEHPEAGACGPRLLNSDGSLQPSAYPMLTPWREFWRLSFLDRIVRRGSYPMHKWPVDAPRRVDVLTGACLLLRRAALEQVGLLDDSYFMYTEEVDLCYRMARHGWQIWWEPRAEVVHHGQASSAHVADAMYVQLYRSKTHFFRKFGGDAEARRFKRLLAMAYRPRLLAATLGGPISPGLKRQAHTFRGLLGQLDQF